jgi:hypothetical protein
MSKKKTRLHVSALGLAIAGMILTALGGGAAFIASQIDDFPTPGGLVAGVMLAIGLAILIAALLILTALGGRVAPIRPWLGDISLTRRSPTKTRTDTDSG